MKRYINEILSCRNLSDIDNVIFSIAMDDRINASECKALQVLAYTKRNELKRQRYALSVKRNETNRIKRLEEFMYAEI